MSFLSTITSIIDNLILKLFEKLAWVICKRKIECYIAKKDQMEETQDNKLNYQKKLYQEKIPWKS